MRAVRSCLIGVFAVACGRGERQSTASDTAQAHSTNANASEMAKLTDAFRKANPPSDPDLTGVWAEIRTVQTMQFLEGHDGPDRVRFDSTGLRVEDGADRPFEWTLTFTKISAGHYLLKERMGGQPHDPENVTLGSAGGFTFTPDLGSDEAHPYSCRVVKSGRIVCLEAEGDGTEFAQISTTVPPPPAPFCPLACVTECAGQCDGIKALTILADAKVCYHLLYPLTHQPTSGAGTDTWLVLSGDSMPPVGTWEYAAVFDDSIVRVAGWRRTEHTPPNANDAARKPYPNGLQLAVTLAGKNVRGDLGYGGAGVSGMMEEEESGHGWGVEGERRPCPSPRDVHP